MAKRTKATKKSPTRKRTNRGSTRAKGAAWTFPKNTLEDALRVARALESKNAGKPMSASDVVRAVGYHKSNDWRFLDLLKSANQYGLVSGSGASATVKMEKIGEDVVAPSSGSQRQQALLEAFRSVEDFRKVEEHYAGKQIPEDEFFENTLVREFGIPRDRVGQFIDTFKANIRYLKLFDATGSALSDSEDPKPSVPVPDLGGGGSETHRRSVTLSGSESSRVREFLDTCFVMMPFGDWFDRYYKEIYAPAIREAGFEPIRADELFSTGSVVEQIWDEISKSTVLLADLTGKNANVFYELGLAHAANKPVVFTSGEIEDVPFDLRHLRVIVYETREPDWAQKLRKSITEYLKNAKADPGRSIPQPFRDARRDEGQGFPDSA